MIDAWLQNQPFIGARNAFLHKLFRRCMSHLYPSSSARDHLMQSSFKLKLRAASQANCELQELS